MSVHKGFPRLCFFNRTFQRGWKRSLTGQILPVQDKNHSSSLYIHWPFCARRCSYCNFNKYIQKQGQGVNQRMTDCLKKELDFYIDYTNTSQITSIFFGGGTPSLMSPLNVQEVINFAIEKCIETHKDVEITLEANPSDLSEARLDGFIQAGINRLSLGIQAFNEKDLEILNRDHGLERGVKTLDLCLSRLGSKDLTSFSVDLIFGRPFQTPKSWQDELSSFLKTYTQIPHVSIYQLTLERGTQLWKDVKGGSLVLPNEDEMSDMYELTEKTLKNYDFMQYEVSNFAKNPDHRSIHNWNYWTGGSYIGIGPGAHSRVQKAGMGCREARIQTLEPDPWMFEVEKYGHGTRKTTTLDLVTILQELIGTSLRTNAGISNILWKDTFNRHCKNRNSKFCTLKDIILSDEKCTGFHLNGLIDLNNGLQMTPKGLMLLDHILPYICNSLENNLNVI